MIKTNTIIKDNENNPLFVVLDYQEYLRIVDELEDIDGIKRDLFEACSLENDKEGKPFDKVLLELKEK